MKPTPETCTYIEIQTHWVKAEHFRALIDLWPNGKYKQTGDGSHEWFTYTETHPTHAFGFGIPESKQATVEVERVWHLAQE